jgi:hypothetical protein
MFQILEIDHLVLRVADLKRMCCASIAMRLAAPLSAALMQNWSSCARGRALIDLVPVDSELGMAGGAAPGKEGHNLEHFCLRIDPFDKAAIRSHLAAQGFEAGAVETRYGAEGFGPSVYVAILRAI